MGHTRHSRYWQRFVLPGEKIIHTFGVSRWYVFVFWGVPSLVALVLAAALFSTNILASVLLFFVGVVFLVPAIYLQYFVHYVVTDRRVMTRVGILHKRFITVDLISVTDLRVYESFGERLLTRTGVIGLNTAGSHDVELHLRHVVKPFELRRDIYKHQKTMVLPASHRPDEAQKNLTKVKT